jgi:hypothetical protein
MKNDKRPMGRSLWWYLQRSRMGNLLCILLDWDACNMVLLDKCYFRKLAGTFRSTVKCLGSFFGMFGLGYRMRFEV